MTTATIALRDAIARGALARVTALRDNRRTRDAQHLFDALEAPRGPLANLLPRAADPFSLRAVLRERSDCERIFLLIRQERSEAIAQARVVARDVLARIGPRASNPALDGEARARALSNLAPAFSAMGDEVAAIEITEFLLARLGLPEDPASVAEHVLSSGTARDYRSRIAVQLNNLAVRRTRLGYIAALVGDRVGARDFLDRAEVDAEQALALRGRGDDPREHDSRLTSRYALQQARLEQAALIVDLAERSEAVSRLREVATEIVLESYRTPTIGPTVRLLRAAGLGKILVEQTLIAESLGHDEEARALGWAARVVMEPDVELYASDADEPIAVSIRFGHALRLCGSTERARAHWQRTRDRVALYRGAESPAVAAVERLIGIVG